MTSQAFAPGSIASLTSSGRSMALPALPPLNFSSNPSSGVDQGVLGFDNSGFTVNYGGAVSTGMPPWLLLLAGVAVGWWLIRRKG